MVFMKYPRRNYGSKGRIQKGKNLHLQKLGFIRRNAYSRKKSLRRDYDSHSFKSKSLMGKMNRLKGNSRSQNMARIRKYASHRFHGKSQAGRLNKIRYGIKRQNEYEQRKADYNRALPLRLSSNVAGILSRYLR